MNSRGFLAKLQSQVKWQKFAAHKKIQWAETVGPIGGKKITEGAGGAAHPGPRPEEEADQWERRTGPRGEAEGKTLLGLGAAVQR